MPESKTAVKSSFSTSEVDTGRKWVDGKAIYKKSISFGSLPNAATKSVAHGISGISYIVSMSGTTDNSLPLPYYADGVFGISLRADTTNVIIATYTDRSSSTAYVTLEYVKSS